PATENDSTFRRLSFVRFSHVGTQKTALEIQPLVLPVQNERSFLVHPDSETRSRRRHGVCPDPGRRWHSVQKPPLWRRSLQVRLHRPLRKPRLLRVFDTREHPVRAPPHSPNGAEAAQRNRYVFR